jgi:hypothetical protein
MTPLLNEADLVDMRAWCLPCVSCGNALRKHYCRECDEFFYVGHKITCSSWRAREHAGHRVDA